MVEGAPVIGSVVREFVRATSRRGVNLLELLAASTATWVWVALVAVGLFTGWSVAVGRGSTTDVARHLFYVPVVLAAVRFGVSGGLSTAVAAGMLAGPLVVLPPGEAAAN